MEKKNFFRYLFDFIVIVLGISVSFWFNQVSIKSNDEKDRMRVLSNIEMEVVELKNYCNDRLTTWNQDIKIYDEFLSDELNIEALSSITTSKSRIEYNLIYYRDFEPPMNRYNSLINSGDIRYIKSEKIKELLTRLHTFNLSNIKTTVAYEKALKEQLIALMTSAHSEVFIAGNNNYKGLESYADLLFQAIDDNPRLKANLLVQMKYFKTRVYLLNQYIYVLEELETELALVKRPA